MKIATVGAWLTIGAKDDLRAWERFAIQAAAENFTEAGRGGCDGRAREQAERNA